MDDRKQPTQVDQQPLPVELIERRLLRRVEANRHRRVGPRDPADRRLETPDRFRGRCFPLVRRIGPATGIRAEGIARLGMPRVRSLQQEIHPRTARADLVPPRQGKRSREQAQQSSSPDLRDEFRPPPAIFLLRAGETQRGRPTLEDVQEPVYRLHGRSDQADITRRGARRVRVWPSPSRDLSSRQATLRPWRRLVSWAAVPHDQAKQSSRRVPIPALCGATRSCL